MANAPYPSLEQLTGTPYDTFLTPIEEQQFRVWKQKYAPQDSGADYDLRGAFKAGLTPDPKTGHWPDTYKKPNHPTFSNESMYAPLAPDKAGSWNGEQYIPPAKKSMDYREFARKVRAKYPKRFDDLDDYTLANELKKRKPERYGYVQLPGGPESAPKIPFSVPGAQEINARPTIPEGELGGLRFGAEMGFDPSSVNPALTEGMRDTMKAGGEEFTQGAGEAFGGNVPLERRAKGASKMIRGGLQAIGPAAMPALIGAAPVSAAVGIPFGLAAQAAVESGAKAIGVPEGYASLAGDVAGIVGGAGLERKAAGAITNKLGGFADDLARGIVTREVANDPLLGPGTLDFAETPFGPSGEYTVPKRDPYTGTVKGERTYTAGSPESLPQPPNPDLVGAGFPERAPGPTSRNPLGPASTEFKPELSNLAFPERLPASTPQPNPKKGGVVLGDVGGSLYEAGATVARKLTERVGTVESPIAIDPATSKPVLTAAQQIAADMAGTRKAATSARSDPKTVGPLTSKLREAYRTGKWFLFNRTPILDTERAAFKAGATLPVQQHQQVLTNHVLNSRTRSNAFLKDSGIIDLTTNLTDRGLDEFNEILISRAVKERAILDAGKEAYSVQAKTNKTLQAIDAAIENARKEFKAESTPEAKENLARAITRREEAQKRFGQSWWDEQTRTNADLEGYGRKAGDVDTVINDPGLNQSYAKELETVRAAQTRLEDMAVESGTVSPELMAYLRRVYPDYVRLGRILEAGEDSPFQAVNQSAVAHLAAQKSIAKRKPNVKTDRVIDSPLDALINRSNLAFEETARNDAARAMAGYTELPVWKDLLRKVDPAEVRAGKFKPDHTNSIEYLENGRKQYLEVKDPLIAKAARGMSSGDVETLRWFLTPFNVSSRIIRTLATGTNLAFGGVNIPRDVIQTAITGPGYTPRTLSPRSMIAGLQAVITKPEILTEMAREGSGFTFSSAARPVKSPDIVSKRAYTNPGQFVREIGRILGNTKRPLSDRISEAGSLTIKSPIEAANHFEDLISKSEQFSRARIYDATKRKLMEPNGAKVLGKHSGLDPADVARGLSEKDAAALAAVEANHALPNYLDGSANPTMRAIMATIPYLNAALQGPRTIFREAARNPNALAVKTAAYIGLPTLLVTLAHYSDPVTAEIHNDIQDFDHKRNLVIIPPRHNGESDDAYRKRLTDSNGKYKTINIPLPQELSTLSHLLRRSITELYRRDPASIQALSAEVFRRVPVHAPNSAAVPIRPFGVGEASTLAIGSVSPFEPSVSGIASRVLPVPVKLPLEFAPRNGWDFFREREIKRDQLNNLPRELADDDQTSELAKRIGSATGVEPVYINHAIRSQFPGMGESIVSGIDNLLLGAETRPGKGARGPAEQLSSRLFSSTAGEGRRVSRANDDAHREDLKRTLYGAVGKQGTDVLKSIGTLPTAGDPYVVKDSDGNPVITETPEQHRIRMEVRGLYLRKLTGVLSNLTADDEWKLVGVNKQWADWSPAQKKEKWESLTSSEQRELKRSYVQKKLRAFDAELKSDYYSDTEITDQDRLRELVAFRDQVQENIRASSTRSSARK